MCLIKIETFTDDEITASRIADLAVAECGAASAHIEQTASVYRWNGEIRHSTEYHIDIIGTEDQKDRIFMMIKENHNYAQPAITWQEISAEKRTAEWIKEGR